MKPWREIAQPHRDVLEGRMKQADFAVDISAVARGNASPEYQDAKEFFSRTYITEGLRHLLISVVRRLNRLDGDPVIQLQTNFGGGKTHTLLAVYHLATSGMPTSELEGIPEVLDQAGIDTLPKAKVAVIDGTRLSPNQPSNVGKLEIRTIWGELAYQLLGSEGYRLLEASDRSGTAPGKEVVAEILRLAAPCVILLDEAVAFFRQLNQPNLTAGSYEANISFVQVLTESVKAVPDAVLLASIPESESEAGGLFGRTVLNTLEKIFARLENVWKPVGADESFEIVRRRLFKSAGAPSEIDAVCREFEHYYRQHKELFPPEVQESLYFERLRSAYPIHPEFFDRLYYDWSTLDNFQRTRGMLQQMAMIIRHLWNSESRGAMIMPGSLPLNDTNVRIKSTQYLSPGWDQVIESEIDGSKSKPKKIDGTEARFGSISAAVRTTRTIFLGTAPSTPAQENRGIDFGRILLGCAEPGQEPSLYWDVLKRLHDTLHYLYVDKKRYWFDTRPNLRREMESRKTKFAADFKRLRETIHDLLRELIGSQSDFAGVHLFAPNEDIPDTIDRGLRLVFTEPERKNAYSAENRDNTYARILDILEYRGTTPRIRRNRLVFVVPDMPGIDNLNDQCATYLAWNEIVEDGSTGRLNMDTQRLNLAKEQRKTAAEIFRRAVPECYHSLLVPFQDPGRKVDFDYHRLSYGTEKMTRVIWNSLKENELVIDRWSEIHLKNILEKSYLKEGVSDVSVKRVWEDTCNYLSMPRLNDESVFCEAVAEGVAKGLFGYASGKEGETYIGFEFRRNPSRILLDGDSLLIGQEAAEDYQKGLDAAASRAVSDPDRSAWGGTEETTSPASLSPSLSAGGSGSESQELPDTSESSAEGENLFFVSIELDPEKSGLGVDISDIIEATASVFVGKPGVNVKIRLDIEAEAKTAFDAGTVRAVKENCRQLASDKNLEIQPNFDTK
ncbi:MAG: ATP-binding protein [Thermoguttaceae bacterium]|jgi:predicted AAA+ superfamily ATPase